MHTNVLMENVKHRHHFQGLGINVRIILKCIQKKFGREMKDSYGSTVASRKGLINKIMNL